MPESNGSLPDGGTASQDLLQLLKGGPRSREGRFYGAFLESKDSDDQ